MILNRNSELVFETSKNDKSALDLIRSEAYQFFHRNPVEYLAERASLERGQVPGPRNLGDQWCSAADEEVVKNSQ